ncbi:AsnC family protein [Aminobacter sp. MSH1]|nr:AsnC family protein [Aminobacter sp. MSH1]
MRFHATGSLASGGAPKHWLESAGWFCDKTGSDGRAGTDGAMKTFFVQIKCELGKAYEVASALADAEIASEIYSTAGNYDLLAKFYVDDEEDIGHFVNERVHSIGNIKDTFTTVTFRAF